MVSAFVTYSDFSQVPDGLKKVAGIVYPNMSSIPDYIKQVVGQDFSSPDLAPDNLKKLGVVKFNPGDAIPDGVSKIALIYNSLPVTNGLVAWYSADKIVGLANGDPVASWPDSSGNGNTASQSTQSKQPTWRTGQINGNPALNFDGVDDFLLMTGLATQLNGCSAFVVALLSSTTATNSGVISINDGVTSDFAAGNTGILWYAGTTPTGAGFAWRGSLQANQTLSMDTWLIYGLGVSGVDNNITQTAYKNGTQFSQKTGGTVTLANNPTQLSIGCRLEPGPTASGNIKIAEIILYSRSLTVAERSLTDHYLGNKYNIAVSD